VDEMVRELVGGQVEMDDSIVDWGDLVVGFILDMVDLG
jgi:hypothetical protein